MKKTIKLIRVGGSLYCRISSFHRDLLGLEEGCLVDVFDEGGVIVVKKR